MSLFLFVFTSLHCLFLSVSLSHFLYVLRLVLLSLFLPVYLSLSLLSICLLVIFLCFPYLSKVCVSFYHWFSSSIPLCICITYDSVSTSYVFAFYTLSILCHSFLRSFMPHPTLNAANSMILLHLHHSNNNISTFMESLYNLKNT